MALADSLPCYPCPYGSACCRYGCDLTTDEAHVLRDTFSQSVLMKGDEGQWRTRDAGKGGCVFVVKNACMLHGTGMKPAVCRAFPRSAQEAEGLCPHFATQADKAT